jgi:hypothetical protein
MFDAKAFLAAWEPPTFVDLDGNKHVGRLWSHKEFLEWLDVFRKWDAGTLEDPEGALRKLIESLGLPAEPVLALPEPALQAALADFFARQKPAALSALTPAAPPPAPGLPTAA